MRAPLALLALLAACSPAADPLKVPQFVWHDPGNVARLDFAHGPGGRSNAPQPPFDFVEEEGGGTQPKILVRDARGHTFSVKFGEEARADVFAPRIAWAAGYFVEPTYFVPEGTIRGVKHLARADRAVDKDGRFGPARFELRRHNPRFLPNASWNWEQNAFAGTPELNGLKILMMLVSNFDNKDIRQKNLGTNTSLFLDETGGKRRILYVVNDWGSAMGRWGGLLTRERWSCEMYRGQTPQFVTGVKDGVVEFGFVGKNTNDFKRNIRVSDVQWLLRTLGQISDEQLRIGLRASGATSEEAACFAGEIRQRIGQLQQAAK